MNTTIPELSFWLVLARARMLLWAVEPEPGCRWIEGDDHLDRIHRGEDIYCSAPVRRLGDSYCAAHWARVYIDPRSSQLKAAGRYDCTREAA